MATLVRANIRSHTIPLTAAMEAGTLRSPVHLMRCKAYEEYRQGINPELEQKDRPAYLRKVIARR